MATDRRYRMFRQRVSVTVLAAFAFALVPLTARAAPATGVGDMPGFVPPGQAKNLPPAERPVICADASGDPAGCQPSIRDLPFGEIPGRRLDRHGNLDPTSPPEDAMAGAFRVEERLDLFRNVEHLYWVPTAPSTFDPATGTWSGGDLDGFPTGWGSTALGIAGDCVFVGRSNSTNTTGNNVFRDLHIFRTQPDPERNPPVLVGTMPQLRTGSEMQVPMRDREARAALYTSTDGVDRMLMVRNAATGTAADVIVYQMDPSTCLPIGEGRTAVGALAHEFYLWQDPKNPNRFLVATQTFGGNVGGQPVDLVVAAITDENTGLVLENPVVLANWTLQTQGGPRRGATPGQAGLTGGLHVDGKFANYSPLMDQWGRRGASQGSQSNSLHSGSLSTDGERFYAAGGTAGLYVLNTGLIANNTNAAILAGSVCNRSSTNVWMGGDITTGLLDVTRLPLLLNDCIHNVLIDDPDVQAMLASGLSEELKRLRYSLLEQRSRFDAWPPYVASVGVHSAVPIPDRPSLSGANPKGRPAYVLITEETPFGPCPERGMRIVSVEVETTPMIVGTLAMHDSRVENCILQASTEPDGQPKEQRPMMHAHNPTVFKNLAFVNWQGHGMRVIDISHPFNPREVGYARPVPWGDVMSYPDFNDGLTYFVDNHTGLHVVKYTGPRADEIPQRGMYSSNISLEVGRIRR